MRLENERVSRVSPRPSELIDRSKSIVFNYEGRSIRAFLGDTVASALYAAGTNIFSRSFKYHRPRGLLCVSGRCPNCLMEVDGVPDVRACVAPAKDGMKVRHQNAWPSLEHDFYSLIDNGIDRFMPVGFYYKTFIHEPIAWHRVEGPIRRIAGIGSVEEEIRRTSSKDNHSYHFEHYYMESDIAVVGGGPAGLTAAKEAANQGVRIVLIDDQITLGGHLLYGSGDVNPEDLGNYLDEENVAVDARQLVSKLVSEISKMENVRILSNATAFGLYESNLLGIVQENRMIRLRAKQVIVATGSHEYPMVFQNNDLPGVFLGRGLQRLVNLYGISPRGRVVIVTNNDQGFDVARTLLEAEIQIVAYIDSRKNLIENDRRRFELKRMESANIPIYLGYTIKEALGKATVRGAKLVQLDAEGSPVENSERKISCEIISLSNGFDNEASLLNQAGCRTVYDPNLDEFVTSDFTAGIKACGEVTGIHDLSTNLVQATVAALNAVQNLQKPDSLAKDQTLEEHRKKLREMETAYLDDIKSTKSSSITAISKYNDIKKMRKRFVCICEDVPEKDLSQAVFEGFDRAETLKRYSTVSMGPCQGKMCSIPSLTVCARETGKTIQETGKTVSRPPFQPLTMGALAGQEFNPVKLTSMHHKHVQLRATMMDMGEWKRPLMYSSVAEEYKAVRERVGIIDVGTLGRLDVKGRDAPKLLDFVYTHIFSRLSVGKSRYGVICDEGGIILDDGTVTRLSENGYFITTTTGNIDFVEQWLTWWATAFEMDVQVTNLTSGLAALNVAGPKARELLQRLTEVDLSTKFFPYLAGKEGIVAGVPCILLRIGFLGETSWEIHFPAEYGEYFWDALMDAGKEFDVKPFGVETQRLLRLEKKHVIVGQDTDAMTNPIEVDLRWAVKFEKSDFVGKAALSRVDNIGVKRKLVGFVMQDSSTSVREGDQVFITKEGGSRPSGFVTSSRKSPAIGRSVGLAWVPINAAVQGSSIFIKAEDKLSGAKVTFPAFYDPEGTRLRS